jgi:hypothetical protein
MKIIYDRNFYSDLWNMDKKNMDDKFIAEISKNGINLMNTYILSFLNQYNPFVRRRFTSLDIRCDC